MSIIKHNIMLPYQIRSQLVNSFDSAYLAISDDIIYLCYY